jgi:hypothetical protein
MSEFKLRSPSLLRRLWGRIKYWRLYRSFSRAVVVTRSDHSTGKGQC